MPTDSTSVPLQLLFGSKENEKAESKGGIISKIVNEPVLLVALVYNPTQVFLCGLS